jgi:hypothetical protein
MASATNIEQNRGQGINKFVDRLSWPLPQLLQNINQKKGENFANDSGGRVSVFVEKFQNAVDGIRCVDITTLWVQKLPVICRFSVFEKVALFVKTGLVLNHIPALLTCFDKLSRRVGDLAAIPFDAADNTEKANDAFHSKGWKRFFKLGKFFWNLPKELKRTSVGPTYWAYLGKVIALHGMRLTHHGAQLALYSNEKKVVALSSRNVTIFNLLSNFTWMVVNISELNDQGFYFPEEKKHLKHLFLRAGRCAAIGTCLINTLCQFSRKASQNRALGTCGLILHTVSFSLHIWGSRFHPQAELVAAAPELLKEKVEAAPVAPTEASHAESKAKKPKKSLLKVFNWLAKKMNT